MNAALGRMAASMCLAMAFGVITAKPALAIEIGSDATASGGAPPKHCHLTPYQASIGMEVGEDYYVKTNGDIYIRCMWVSNGLSVAPKTEIGFFIACPGYSNIVNPGFAVGTASLDKVRVTGAVAVPLQDGTDSAQVSAYVEDPTGPFQLFTMALCRG